MSIVKIAPENLEVANKYLELNDVKEVARHLCVSADKVAAVLEKKEVANYINAVYLDTGYRNRFKLATIMDEIIESKLQEAKESEMFSKKDLVDILKIAHDMKMSELKAQREHVNQTNIQINNDGVSFGQGNYGKLMEKLLGGVQGNPTPVRGSVLDPAE
jgi:hypothetical protein